MTDKNTRENLQKTVREYAAVFGVGSIGYSAIEILWRGRTHWTMALTGGACMSGLYALSKKEQRSTWKFCLEGAGMITAAEFFVGLIVNKKLKWGVWDYSNIPFNLMGQICPLYSFFWFLLCRPGNQICKRLNLLMNQQGFSLLSR